MLKKGTKLNSILTGTCPRCQQEKMYVNKNPYILSSLFKMNEKCSICELSYHIEPSFFYGAMYVNYALTVIVCVATFVISKLLLNLTLTTTIIAIIAALVILMPVNSRLSRNIYINMFVSFEKEIIKK